MPSASNTDCGCDSAGMNNSAKHTPIARGGGRPGIKLECDRLPGRVQTGRQSRNPSVSHGQFEPVLELLAHCYLIGASEGVAHAPSKTLRSGMARADRRELNLKTEFAKFGG